MTGCTIRIQQFTIKTALPATERAVADQRRTKRRSALTKRTTLLLLLLLLFSSGGTVVVQAIVPCRDDRTCVKALRDGSVCRDGSCTNPFADGCLRQLRPDLPHYAMPRTCNSDDDSENGNSDNSLVVATNNNDNKCRPSTLNYPEIRIHAQNWDSAMLSAWVMQILLSEFLNVPVTIETSTSRTTPPSSSSSSAGSFYDTHGRLQYGALGYDYDALRLAHRLGDCRLRTNKNEPCAMIIPEVWNGQSATVRSISSKEGVIEMPMGSGAVGKFSWFIPRYLAEQDTTLLEYLGFQGRENRKKVASTFGRPTRWGDYCLQVSDDNCTLPTNISARAPQTEDEAELFLAANGLYQGHFGLTEENNCTGDKINSCTGHIADVPCEWSTFATSQAFWHDINVQSSGPREPNHAYGYSELTQIYLAANATRSPLLLYWWTPEAIHQQFLGTDAELMKVQLRPPSQRCVEGRVTPEGRCSDDFLDQVGDEESSCDGEPHSLVKLIVSTMWQQDVQTEPALRSPAYTAIKSLTLSELQLGEMLKLWYSSGKDPGYDARMAACQWVADNVEFLENFLPPTFPRVVQDREWALVWTFAAILSCIAAVAVASTALLVHRYQNKPIIIYAQIHFLFILLGGLFLMSLGAIVASVQDPSPASCITSNWLIVLGYSLSVVPLIVKVAAVNRLHFAAQRLRRIRVKKSRLYKVVGYFCCVVVVFLTLKTILDQSTRKAQLDLSEERAESGETIVSRSLSCDSESPVWQYMELGWYCVLLFIASVLAFQSRDIRQEFNETQTLAFIIYAKFVFAILLLFTIFLESSISSQLLFGYQSLLNALDALVSLTVYFVPKLYQAITDAPITSTLFFRTSLSRAGRAESLGSRNSTPISSRVKNRDSSPHDVTKSATAAPTATQACVDQPQIPNVVTPQSSDDGAVQAEDKLSADSRMDAVFEDGFVREEDKLSPDSRMEAVFDNDIDDDRAENDCQSDAAANIVMELAEVIGFDDLKGTNLPPTSESDGAPSDGSVEQH